MAQNTRELLERILQGESLTPIDIDNLVSGKTEEDLFLDYKHGREIEDAKKGARTIREYLSGFANSAGGLLIIGIDEKNWKVTGAKAPSEHDLAKWASDIIVRIAPYFSPPPRFQVVHHSEGDILIAATERSMNLVPNLEGNQLTYYLRIHDKTLKAPDYLISDLFLGRRQYPYLRIVGVRFSQAETHLERERYYGLDFYFSLQLEVENQSLSWAEKPEIGFISLLSLPMDTKTVSSQLMSHIDLRKPDESKFPAISLMNHFAVTDNQEIKPFSVRTHYSGWGNRFVIPFHRNNEWFNYSWNAAIYLISKNSPPIWYQIKLKVLGDMIGWIRTSIDELNHHIEEILEITRVGEGRPVVSWEL